MCCVSVLEGSRSWANAICRGIGEAGAHLVEWSVKVGDWVQAGKSWAGSVVGRDWESHTAGGRGQRREADIDWHRLGRAGQLSSLRYRQIPAVPAWRSEQGREDMNLGSQNRKVLTRGEL